MSGPPVMVEAGHTLFMQYGLDESRFFSDAFEYAAIAEPGTPTAMSVAICRSLADVRNCWELRAGPMPPRPSAPWQAAILHQLAAVLLWVLVLRARFLARYPLVQSVRAAR